MPVGNKNHLKRILWKKSLNLLCSVFLIAAILLAILTRTGQLDLRVIRSGSMEPNISIGSLIMTRKTDPQKIKKGDVISFMPSEGQVVSHRVNAIIHSAQGLKFQTKGDSNQLADAQLISPKKVVGKMIWHLSGLGYVWLFMQQPQGILGAILVIATVLILASLVKIVRPVKSEEK